MAWTSPRTWTAGEVPSAAVFNLHVRDNLKAIGDPWTAWTPTVTASVGAFTTVAGAGRYIAAGKLIIWSATITITTVGTASSYVAFTLPVTAQAAAGHIGAGYSSAGPSNYVFLNTASQAHIGRYDGNTVIAAGVVLRLSGAYEAA